MPRAIVLPSPSPLPPRVSANLPSFQFLMGVETREVALPTLYLALSSQAPSLQFAELNYWGSGEGGLAQLATRHNMYV